MGSAPHEDDALRTVRAAAEVLDPLASAATESGVTLRFRTGVNTGPVLACEGENLDIVRGDSLRTLAQSLAKARSILERLSAR